MENQPIKKKKKYVKKSAPEDTNTTNNEEQIFNGTLTKVKFSYTFDQFLNYLIADLLPDNRFIIRLNDQLISGEEKDINALVKKLDANSKYYSGFIIQLRKGLDRDDIQYQIEEVFQARLFGGKFIEKLIVGFFLGSMFEQDCTEFLRMFKHQEYERLFVRINRRFEDIFIDKIKEKAHRLRESTVSDKETRGTRKNLRSEASTVVIDGKYFDTKQWGQFLSKSDKLNRKDIEVVEKRSQYGPIEAYAIRLLVYPDEKEVNLAKLSAFNYYFRHQDFIRLPLKESDHKSDLVQKYGSFDQNWLTIKVIRGYKSSKWDDKTLLYKIRTNTLSHKRTNFTNEFFQAFHLQGLLPKVREYLEELQYEINNVPLDDVREELFLDLDEQLKDALKSSERIEWFVEGFIKDFAARFNNICQITSVRFPLRGIKLNVLVLPGKDQEFRKSVRYDLQKLMMKQISIRESELDFGIDKQLLQRLKDQGINVVEHSKNKFSYIQKNDKLEQTIVKIQDIQRELQSSSQEYVEVQGKTNLPKYLQLITSLKESKEFEMIYVTEPESRDRINYKIGFIGPRKNNTSFVQVVQSKIGEIEKTLGCYFEAIDEQQASFLIEDGFIQEEINKKYNITMVVDPSYTLKALLEVQPKYISKKIFIYKSKNLNMIPFGSSIYFIGKKQLEQFQEKYLDTLKLKSKRMTKNQLIKQLQPNRQLKLHYQSQLPQNELLNISLAEQNSGYICFILPSEKRQAFIQQILSLLTASKTYEKMEYEIIIIDSESSDDIKKLINLPQFSTVQIQEELVVQWFCQGKPYSKSGNIKINDAIAKGLTKCLITEQDLTVINQKSRTHICDLTKNVITSTRTGQQIPIISNSISIKFSYKGYSLQFSPQQMNLIKYYRGNSHMRFYLSLTYYQIDLISMKQINLFSRKIRSIQKTDKLVKLNSGLYGGKIHAFYDHNYPQVIYSFQQTDSKKLFDAVTTVNGYIQSKIITQAISIKGISQQLIKSRAEQNQLTYQYNQNLNKIIIKSLNIKNIQKFKAIIERQMEYQRNLEQLKSTNNISKSIMKFPQNWQNQSKQIQLFNVGMHTRQFLQVQQQFTLRPIKSLQRVQNKYLYRKYMNQLDHLTFLNNNKKPKEMMLFHGTSQTQPEAIWGDKQQGFNINYSSDQCLLGRGIYFAQKSEYSNGYKYRYPNEYNTFSMFLCKVIVGDSQNMPMSHVNNQVKDTQAKNNSGLKYESMKGKHDICDIYVVYKNKRAYPSYLIKF